MAADDDLTVSFGHPSPIPRADTESTVINPPAPS